MISIVVPVYNEESNVEPLFNEIVNVMANGDSEVEVIFVDDGSQDNTLKKLKALQANQSTSQVKLRVLELQRNYGQTPALLAGLNNSKGEIIVTLDGDLQNDPHDIPKLLGELSNGYDVICGWRKNRHDSLLKKFFSKINNLLNRRLNKVAIHDSGCTLRAYKREAITNLQLFAEEHRYIPSIIASKGFKIGEMETTHHPRVNGKTKYGFKRLFRGFNDLLTLRMLKKWGPTPSRLFNFYSFVSFAAGSICALWALFERVLFFRIWTAAYPEPLPLRTNSLLLIGFNLALFGLFLFLLGFFAELLYRQITDPNKSYQIKREWS